MGVRAKSPARRHSIVVEDTQCPEAHMSPVEVTRKRKCMVGIKPAMVKVTAFAAAADGDHRMLLFRFYLPRASTPAAINGRKADATSGKKL
jgi:hypothetical protein